MVEDARADIADTLESMNDAFFSVDKDWRIKQINSEMVKKGGKSREELIG